MISFEEWRFATKDELLDAMRAEFDAFAGVAYGFTRPIEIRVSEISWACVGTWPSSSSAVTWTC